MVASWAPTIIDNESFTKSFGTSYGHIEICFHNYRLNFNLIFKTRGHFQAPYLVLIIILSQSLLEFLNSIQMLSQSCV